MNHPLIEQLTLDEKIALLSGSDFWHTTAIERLGIRSLLMTDGPHGVRLQTGSGDHIGLSQSVPATCFPTASSLASSWNPDLLHQVGERLGRECAHQGISILLGPGANLKRSPLCGRNFEYFSEDPLLSGQLASAWINGLQSVGVGACLKHFVANNQETHRMVSDAYIDERALHELYLKSFEIPLKQARPASLMTSYNLVNGSYVGEHSVLLKRIVREDWNYQGVVITDWTALNDPVAARLAGLDLEMPGNKGVYDTTLRAAIQRQELPLDVVDASVSRLLHLQDDARQLTPGEVDYSAHHHAARSIASECMVLLKNKDNILPITPVTSIALVGAFAESPRYQGAGSSLIQPTSLPTLKEVLTQRHQGPWTYAPGYSLQDDETHDELIEEAVRVASTAEVIVALVGLPASYESEGFDRSHLDLPPSHNALIHALLDTHKPLVVLLANGAPVTLPWVDEVDGIIEAYLGGQGGAEALLDIVYGDVNPSGKLAETFPASLADLPVSKNYPSPLRHVLYHEGLYVGYRGVDQLGLTPLFPFGFGLSYTEFELDAPKLQLESDYITVSLHVHNCGDREGAEVIQVYSSHTHSLVHRPPLELKAFRKVFIAAQQQELVNIVITFDELKIWNHGSWRLEGGEYDLSIGTSSRDIHHVVRVTIPSSDVIVPDIPDDSHDGLPLYRELASLSCPTEPPVRPFHRNTLLSEVGVTWLGRQLQNIIMKEFEKMLDETTDPLSQKLMRTMVVEMPLRSIVANSQGTLTMAHMDALIALMNGHPWSALKALFAKKK